MPPKRKDPPVSDNNPTENVNIDNNKRQRHNNVKSNSDKNKNSHNSNNNNRPNTNRKNHTNSKYGAFYYIKPNLTPEQITLHTNYQTKLNALLGASMLPPYTTTTTSPPDDLKPLFPIITVAPIKGHTTSNRFIELNYDTVQHSYDLDPTLPQGIYKINQSGSNSNPNSAQNNGKKQSNQNCINDDDDNNDDSNNIEQQDLLSIPITNTNKTLGPDPFNQLRTNYSFPHTPLAVRKYFSQKYRLFTRYDFGILLDTEGWFSVTPEQIAAHVARRIISKCVISLIYKIHALLTFSRNMSTLPSHQENTHQISTQSTNTELINEIIDSFDQIQSNPQHANISSVYPNPPFDQSLINTDASTSSPSSSITSAPIIINSAFEFSLVQKFCTKKPITIFDVFCGAGGNAIQFASTIPTLIFQLKPIQDNNTNVSAQMLSLPLSVHVITAELDRTRTLISQHNARIYGVEKQISFFWGNAYKLIQTLLSIPHLVQIDALFLSPPWGGIKYDQFYDINASMGHINGTTLFAHCNNLTSNITYFLPKTINPAQVARLALIPKLPQCKGECMGNITKCIDKDVYSNIAQSHPNQYKMGCDTTNNTTHTNTNNSTNNNNNSNLKIVHITNSNNNKASSTLNQNQTYLCDHHPCNPSSPLFNPDQSTIPSSQQKSNNLSEPSQSSSTPSFSLYQPHDVATLDNQFNIPTMTILFMRLYLLTIILFPDVIPNEMFEWYETLHKTNSQHRNEAKQRANKAALETELSQQHNTDTNIDSSDLNTSNTSTYINLGNMAYLEPEYKRILQHTDHFFLYFDQFDVPLLRKSLVFHNLRQQSNQSLSTFGQQSTMNDATSSNNNNNSNNHALDDTFWASTIPKLQQLLFLITSPLPTTPNLPSLTRPTTLFDILYQTFIRCNSQKLLFLTLVQEIFNTHPTFLAKRAENTPQQHKIEPIEFSTNKSIQLLTQRAITYIPAHELPPDYFVLFQADDIQNFSYLAQTTSLSLFFHYLNITNQFDLICRVLYPTPTSFTSAQATSTSPQETRDKINHDNSNLSLSNSMISSTQGPIPIITTPSQTDLLYKTIQSNQSYTKTFIYLDKMTELLLSFILQPHIGLNSLLIPTSSTNHKQTEKNSHQHLQLNEPPDCGLSHISFSDWYRMIASNNSKPSPTEEKKVIKTSRDVQSNNLVEFEAACFKTYSKGFNIYFQ